jgi:hypothetical protein
MKTQGIEVPVAEKSAEGYEKKRDRSKPVGMLAGLKVGKLRNPGDTRQFS